LEDGSSPDDLDSLRRRFFMTRASRHPGDGAQGGDKGKRDDYKDSFDFHKFAFIGVQLSLSHNRKAIQEGAALRNTTNAP
jgi:hypothetical protein